jgi:hypothetical protein
MNEGSGENVADLSGRSNAGVLQDDASWGVGLSGYAINLDGTNDFVDIDYISLGSDATYIFMFKRIGTGTQYLFSIMDILIRVTNTVIEYFPNVSDEGGEAGSWTQNSGWNYLVITQGGTVCNMYLNGRIILDNAACAVLDNTDRNRDAIGAWTTNHWEGVIDHVLLYNRALSQQEQSQLNRDPYAMFRAQNIFEYLTAAAPAGGIPLFMHSYRRRRTA